MSASHQKRTSERLPRNVRLVPKANICSAAKSTAIRSSRRHGRTPAISLDGRLWNLGWNRGSVRLDAGELDHLRPFLGFVGDELAKVGGREREHVATEVEEPCLDLGIGKASVDLLVELLDDLGRRGLWCANAVPSARLVAPHELSRGRDVRQC